MRDPLRDPRFLSNLKIKNKSIRILEIEKKKRYENYLKFGSTLYLSISTNIIDTKVKTAYDIEKKR